MVNLAAPDAPVPAASDLTVRGLSKTFSGQRALCDVSMTFPAGKVTAVLGQNGSGKSTLIKILAGFHHPDAGGEVTIGGTPLKVPVDARDAYRRGLRFMHQDLGLIDALPIVDNFAFSGGFATRGVFGPIRGRREHDRVAAVLERFGIQQSPTAVVSTLDPTTKTMIAMARAVFSHERTDVKRPMVLILDEPTAALPHEAVGKVLDLTHQISDDGGSVVYVTHRIDEVLRAADRVVVLRDGRVIIERDIDGLDGDAIVALITGGSTVTARPSGRVAGTRPTLLELDNVSGHRLREVSLSIQQGEIVGVGGMMGCGRSELARIVAGAQAMTSGQARLADAAYQPANPAEALASGVAFVPQNRRSEGCILEMSLQDNLTLGTLREFSRHGWLDLSGERKAARQTAGVFGIVPQDPKRMVANFSGGNQQKAVIAKALRHQPRLLVLDDPMQGVDVGAKAELARVVRELAEDGLGILIGSTDVEDLVGICDRVIVLNRGRIVGTLVGSEITKDRLILVSSES